MTDSPIQLGFERARLTRGVVSGLLGGIVFGALLTMVGMMPMIAMLVGSTSIAVGWVVHLFLSAVFGALFAIGVVPGPLPRTLGLGIAWGLVLWVVAAMIVMRSVMGVPIAFDANATRSLMGHLIYGLFLGGTYALLPTKAPRAGGASAAR